MCATLSPARAEISSNVGIADEVAVRCVPSEVEILRSCAPTPTHKNTHTKSARSAKCFFPLEHSPNAQLL